MLNLTYSIADQNLAATKSVGILNLSIHLLEAIAASKRLDHCVVLTNSTIRCDVSDKKCRLLFFNQVIKNRLARILWDQSGVYRAAGTTGNNWLFLPKGFASFVRKPPCCLAAYVHDTMHQHYAMRYPGKTSAFEAWYFRNALKGTIRNADVIITNSEFTRDELRRVAKSWGLSLPRTITAGIGFLPVARIVAAKKDQVVFLASKWPHKLTSLAIEYASRWQTKTEYGGEVLWIGPMNASCAFPSYGNWRHHPRLPENQFRQILEESRALAFFSDYEGFGMPPVEAIISLTCPVFSDIAATREVMGGAGFAFKNDEYSSFTAAMGKALSCDPPSIDAWKRKLLDTHNWTKVVNTIVTAVSDPNVCSI